MASQISETQTSHTQVAGDVSTEDEGELKHRNVNMHATVIHK